jgi:hypothetical protein
MLTLKFVVKPEHVRAAPVLIDFGAVGGAPTFGGTWNTIPNPSGTTQLVDATGVTTTINVSFSDHWFDSLQISPWSHGDIAWIDANFTAPPGFIAFTGLATNLLYRIDLLPAEEFGDPSLGTGDFSIFGSFGDSVPNGDNFNIHTDGLVNGHFITWGAVTPNASGEIFLDIAGSDTTNPHMLGTFVSAARITCLQRSAAGAPQEVNCPASVPGPETILLLALGLAGILAMRRLRARAEE